MKFLIIILEYAFFFSTLAAPNQAPPSSNGNHIKERGLPIPPLNDPASNGVISEEGFRLPYWPGFRYTKKPLWGYTVMSDAFFVAWDNDGYRRLLIQIPAEKENVFTTKMEFTNDNYLEGQHAFKDVMEQLLGLGAQADSTHATKKRITAYLLTPANYPKLESWITQLGKEAEQLVKPFVSSIDFSHETMLDYPEGDSKLHYLKSGKEYILQIGDTKVLSSTEGKGWLMKGTENSYSKSADSKTAKKDSQTPDSKTTVIDMKAKENQAA